MSRHDYCGVTKAGLSPVGQSEIEIDYITLTPAYKGQLVENGVVRFPPMPWRLLAVCGLIGVVGGAVVGFARGLTYLPTLPFAIVEGAILFGVPASVLGLLLVGCCSLVRSTRRRAR